MSTNKKHTRSALSYAFGPGIVLAAAAIGVSHLVQSTRAGAEYGFLLVWAVVLANVSKYPFLEFGPRYTAVKQESIIQGYRKLGVWYLRIFAVFTVISMCIVQAAVTIVSASLAAQLTGIELTPLIWSIILLVICVFILVKGQYAALDRAIKLIIVVLSISTIVALVVALINGGNRPDIDPPPIWTGTGIAFLIALMGWMPILIDGSAWHSLWILERIKQTRHAPKLRETLTDFNIGFIGAALMALGFLSLGALIMYGTGVDFASSGAAFASQLVRLYTETLGEWSYWIIIICAFTAMFSTTLTVTDAYPRTLVHILSINRGLVETEENEKPLFVRYSTVLILISVVSIGVLYFTGERFIFLIDLATTLSFVMSPVFAYINYKLIYSEHFPGKDRPPLWLKYLSWFGLIFITGFTLLFLYWRLFYG